MDGVCCCCCILFVGCKPHMPMKHKERVMVVVVVVVVVVVAVVGTLAFGNKPHIQYRVMVVVCVCACTPEHGVHQVIHLGHQGPLLPLGPHPTTGHVPSPSHLHPAPHGGRVGVGPGEQCVGTVTQRRASTQAPANGATSAQGEDRDGMLEKKRLQVHVALFSTGVYVDQTQRGQSRAVEVGEERYHSETQMSTLTLCWVLGPHGRTVAWQLPPLPPSHSPPRHWRRVGRLRLHGRSLSRHA